MQLDIPRLIKEPRNIVLLILRSVLLGFLAACIFDWVVKGQFQAINFVSNIGIALLFGIAYGTMKPMIYEYLQSEKER